jgi:hypothetical protein
VTCEEDVLEISIGILCLAIRQRVAV